MPDRNHTRSRLAVSLILVLTFAAFDLNGCSKPSSGGSGNGTTTPTVDPYANMTGNWQITASPTTGGTPFTALSGNFYELNVNAAAHQTTAALLVQSTGCYANAGTVPLIGNVEQPKVALTSFEVNAQYLTLTAQKDLAGETFSGTYVIRGGCADGDTGTLIGTRYAVLTGSYSGKLPQDATKTLSLSLTQDGLGTGGGTTLMAGSAAFTGFSCFTKGGIGGTGTSYVSGSSVTLFFSTNEAGGSQVTIVGTLDPTASTIDVTSIQVTGGSCSGTYGSSTLMQG